MLFSEYISIIRLWGNNHKLISDFQYTFWLVYESNKGSLSHLPSLQTTSFDFDFDNFQFQVSVTSLFVPTYLQVTRSRIS